MTDSSDYQRSEDEILALVRAFESCSIPPADFKHSAHLLVAFSYLRSSRLTVPKAAERMRTSLFRYLDYHGVDRLKYNETVTLFWIKLLQGFLNRADSTRSIAELASEMLETFAQSQLIKEYYSPERLSSEEARENWIEPDLKPLDF